VGWAETNPGSTSRWLPFEHGKTIGTEGSEFGEIVLDEELALVGPARSCWMKSWL
jgi:hypothetical protein